jgi:GNAT superfamily N-acetyltransferase
MNLILEEAKKDHVEDICKLVNIAYRGEQGWTKETDLVEGERANETEILEYITDPNAHLLIAVENEELVSCICIEKKDIGAYIGLFAVHPKLQGTGLGKIILSQAENYASTELKVKKYVMVVLSQRKELIEFYERRGYVRTGDKQEYPVHLNVGIPLKNDLTIEYLEKYV